jgi:hypothetical protein
MKVQAFDVAIIIAWGVLMLVAIVAYVLGAFRR